MRTESIFLQIFFLLIQIYFASKIEGSKVSGKKPIGHLIKTNSDKFFIQHSNKKEKAKKTDKDNGKKKDKMKKSKKRKKTEKHGRKEDFNLLCMFGLCGGGGGLQVELLRNKF